MAGTWIALTVIGAWWISTRQHSSSAQGRSTNLDMTVVATRSLEPNHLLVPNDAAFDRDPMDELRGRYIAPGERVSKGAPLKTGITAPAPDLWSSGRRFLVSIAFTRDGTLVGVNAGSNLAICSNGAPIIPMIEVRTIKCEEDFVRCLAVLEFLPAQAELLAGKMKSSDQVEICR